MALSENVINRDQQLGEAFMSAKLKNKVLEQAKKRTSVMHTLSHLSRWLALLVLLELIRMSATRRMMRSEPPERTFARVIMEVNKQPEPGQEGKPTKEYFPKPAKGSRKQSLHVITFDENQPKKSWFSLGSSFGRAARAAAVEPKSKQPVKAVQQQPLRQRQQKPAAAKDVLQQLEAAKRHKLPRNQAVMPEQAMQEAESLKQLRRVVQDEVERQRRL